MSIINFFYWYFYLNKQYDYFFYDSQLCNDLFSILWCCDKVAEQNKGGPKIDPCGTPHLIIHQEDTLLYIYTVCLFDTFFHMPTLYIFFITFIESGLFSLQLNWLNKYYETIRRLVGPELDEQDLDEEKDWMLKHTESFIQSGTSASVCSSSLTLIALAVALLHNIIWAASSLLHSLHSQQTRALMLPLCSLYWAAIPGWEIHCNLAFSFDWRIYLFDNLIGWVNGW